MLIELWEHFIFKRVRNIEEAPLCDDENSLDTLLQEATRLVAENIY
jgi:hypothetical protein